MALLDPQYSHRAVGAFDRTGGGKSAIAQVVGALLGGITLFLLPTLALQGDQYLRQKGRRNTLVYNLNICAKDKASATHILRELEKLVVLAGTDRRRLPRVSIYISPAMLNSSKTWQAFFGRAAAAGAMNLVVLDEAHLFDKDSVLYRSDFAPLKESLFDMLQKYRWVRILCLSATSTQETVRKLKKYTESIWTTSFGLTPTAWPNVISRLNGPFDQNPPLLQT